VLIIIEERKIINVIKRRGRNCLIMSAAPVVYRVAQKSKLL